MRASTAVAFAVILLVGACGGGTVGGGAPGGSGEGPGPAAGGLLPCDVRRVLAAGCQECHAATPQFGAPMALVSHADLLRPAPSNAARRTIDVVLDRIAGNPSQMPPLPRPALAEADQAVLRAWLAAGTPSSTEETCGAVPTPPTPQAACTPDVTLAPASPWTMPAIAGDEYVCWGAELTADAPRHVTGFVPRIDNTKIVHHVVLFEAPKAVSPTPTPCDSGGSLAWRMVMGWAPGAGALELPPEAGFPIAADGKATHYVVQMHYSNPQGLTGETDTSGFDLCTSDPRPNEADVVAFGTHDITIPPYSGTFPRTCEIAAPAEFDGIRLFAAMPHMHKLGVRMETKLLPASGGPEVDLGTVPAFSFDTQAWLPVNATVQTNDRIRTTCTWQNPTAQTVSFGERTDEEMCYSFTIYWPKVKRTPWSWAIPALYSECQ